jgi:copper chaperone CopZ
MDHFKEPNPNELTLQIGGMTCGSCELILERKIGKLPGVERVHVNHKTGVARIKVNPANPPSLLEIQDVIEKAGYHLGENKEELAKEPNQKWLEIWTSLILIYLL